MAQLVFILNRRLRQEAKKDVKFEKWKSSISRYLILNYEHDRRVNFFKFFTFATHFRLLGAHDIMLHSKQTRDINNLMEKTSKLQQSYLNYS